MEKTEGRKDTFGIQNISGKDFFPEGLSDELPSSLIQFTSQKLWCQCF